MAYATFLKQCCFFVPVVNTKSILITALAVGFLSIFHGKETEETLKLSLSANCFIETVLCSPGWSQMHFITEND
ncbi:hypothetical protein I79_021384 [Cricetulus griseus]|uniref:Uncharacterized protein n=1 Tax=Cricetulus griseus TaxID=10029 RepID=G3ICI6_CRIGR|nr:hypothetical protein I79_021384 [Cricetulus griseus]